MVHSGRMHQRKQQIKPRQNRIYKRFIVAFLVVGVARLELAASCSQIVKDTCDHASDCSILHRINAIFVHFRSALLLRVFGE